MQFNRLENESDVVDLIQCHNSNSEYVTIDTETTGLDTFTATLLDIVIQGYEPNSAFAIPGKFVHTFKELSRPIVAHNFKYDFAIFYRYGVDLRRNGLYIDTMLLHHLIEPDSEHGLDSIVQSRYKDNYKERFWSKYTKFEHSKIKDQFDLSLEMKYKDYFREEDWNNYKYHTDGTVDDSLEYMCKDVIYTNLLAKDLLLEAQDLNIPFSLIRMVHQYAEVLYNTELDGLKVDREYLMSLGMELKPKIEELKRGLTQLAGGYVTALENEAWADTINKLYSPRGTKWKTVEKQPFNWDSNSQVAKLLYDKLELPEQKNKKTKQRTVDDAALETLKPFHPIVESIQDLRTKNKVYTAFIEGTLDKIREGDRIHPSFNINGTVTGRISSSNPNMQQLPSSGDWAKVRGIYVPDTGYYIVTCDYGQLEVVIAAHFSQDKNLLKIINEGASKHDITAEALGIPRKTAKTLNFAMQYLCSPRKVKDILQCSDKDAEYAHAKYWETYSGEKRVIDECKAKVDMGDPIVTPWGRRRQFPLRFEKPWQREAAYRQAYSTLIQGTGADCTNWAATQVDKRLKNAITGKLMFTIHDELLTQIDRRCLSIGQEIIKSTMIEAGTVINLSLPLTVDCSDGLERWQK